MNRKLAPKYVANVIALEREYQDAKWGTIEEHPHTVAEWMLIIEGELNEAKHDWQKGSSDEAALAEIVQVAAVAFACLEQHGTGFSRNFIGDRATALADLKRQRLERGRR